MQRARDRVAAADLDGLGSLMFVILGAPIGIRFARRDFLSAFMTCFLPIIAIYYPLMLVGVNMSKEGQLAPIVSLWIGNLLLALGRTGLAVSGKALSSKRAP